MRTRNPNYRKAASATLGESAPGRAGAGPTLWKRVDGTEYLAWKVRAPSVTDLGDDEVQIGGEGTGNFTNASGATLNIGDVVVIVGDTVVTTTTAQDTRPMGVVVGGADNGESTAVQTSGIVEYVRVTAAVTAGRYAETTTTAGAAFENATPRAGSFGQFLTAGTTPRLLMFGQTYLTGGGSGGGGVPGWFNVRDYGAVGDGSTDDAQAFDDAILALNTAGSGVLYVPASPTAYLVSRALDSITVPCTLMGDGIETLTAPAGIASLITCSSATAQVFTFTVGGVSIRDIALRNTSAGATAGGALALTNGTAAVFQAVEIRNFYTAIDIQLGARWHMADCTIHHFTKYGVRQRNATDPDDGDWTMVGCQITSTVATSQADACVRIESGGGGKIVNCKMGGATVTRGIDAVAATGVTTTILLITNVSIENMDEDAIHLETTGTGSYGMLQVTNCQFGLYSNTTGRAIRVVAATLGLIQHVLIDDIIVRSTGGNANACVDLTNVDIADIGSIINAGMGSKLATSGCTNIIDNTGAVAGVAISGVPTSGQVPTATGAATATWQTLPASAEHAHVISEEATGTGAATVYLLDNDAEADTVAAYVAGSRTDVTHSTTNPAQVTFAVAPSAAAVIRFDYVASLA